MINAVGVWLGFRLRVSLKILLKSLLDCGVIQSTIVWVGYHLPSSSFCVSAFMVSHLWRRTSHFLLYLLKNWRVTQLVSARPGRLVRLVQPFWNNLKLYFLVIIACSCWGSMLRWWLRSPLQQLSLHQDSSDYSLLVQYLMHIYCSRMHHSCIHYPNRKYQNLLSFH